jgi:hypothetical protein
MLCWIWESCIVISSIMVEEVAVSGEVVVVVVVYSLIVCNLMVMTMKTDKYKNGITPGTFMCVWVLRPHCHQAWFHITSSGLSALFAQRPPHRAPLFPPPFPSHFFPFLRLYFLR